MSAFDFEPAECVPFRDRNEVARVRAIHGDALLRHPNPDFRIQVVPDAEFEHRWLLDIFQRIVRAREEGRRCVLILPQPWPGYRWLARMLNIARVSCDHLHTFNMDEYANERGESAPETWEHGFMYAMLTHFYAQLDPELRPPREQIHGPTHENVDHYGELMQAAGGVDCCYGGPGWTGHIAFCEPDCPEFSDDLEEWKTQGARWVTLSPFSIAQNSLFGGFGLSGDLTAVPPRAVTIGPAEVIAAKHRVELHGITVGGSEVSWQRTMSRLCLHGPVTPKLPSSLHQLLRTDVWVSESIAAPIVPRWDKGY